MPRPASTTPNEDGITTNVGIAMEPVAVHAAGRGNPWVNFRDGLAVETRYTGPEALVQTMQAGLAVPLALATGDFDEDGVTDVVSAYVGPTGGILALHPGNFDALYPASFVGRRAARTYTDAPLLPRTPLSAAPVRPELLAAGDFDHDGHLDLVAAAEGTRRLHLLRGDGTGRFQATDPTVLPGAVTTLLAADLDRHDRRMDLAVGTTGEEGAALLHFSDRRGAWLATPERYALPAAATALAADRFDDDGKQDLAVAAGRDVLIFYARQKHGTPRTIKRHRFPQALTALAAGQFAGDGVRELAALGRDGTLFMLDPQTEDVRYADFGVAGTALLTNKTSSREKMDLAVLDPAGRQIHLLHTVHFAQMQALGEAEAAAWYPEATALPQPSAAPVTFDVEGTPVALQALRLNRDGLHDLVVLKTGGPNALAVVPSTPMAAFLVDSPLETVDASPGDGICADAGAMCTLRAAIEEANALAGPDMITFSPAIFVPFTPHTLFGSSYPSIVETLSIDGSALGMAVVLGDMGVTPGDGFTFAGTSTGSTVMAMNIGDFGFGSGIGSSGMMNTFASNFIGTDPAGLSAAPNGVGITLEGDSDLVMGSLISGNGFDGVKIDGFSTGDGDGNVVDMNTIGVDLPMTSALPNLIGVGIAFGMMNTVMGNTVDSNTSIGVSIGEDGDDNTVVSNTITGTTAGPGVNISGSSMGAVDNTIGGTTGIAIGSCVGDCNDISGNTGDGVKAEGASDLGNAIINNSISGNTELGIDLIGVDGVDANDAGDGDSSPNKLQNFPVISSTSISGGDVLVEYCVDTIPVASATYPLTVHFYEADAAASGEGETLLGGDIFSATDFAACPFTPKMATLTGAAAFVTMADFVVGTATDADDNTSEFSMLLVPLPVELVSFEAVTDGDAAVLTWTTVSETNNAGFEVQHGINPATDGERTWERIGYVEGHGTTIEMQTYTHRAENLVLGTHRFRLKQIDFDGTFEFSPEVEVFIKVPGTFHLSEAYPNPFNPQTQFTLTIRRRQHVQIAVYDALGRQVQLLYDGRLEAEQPRTFTFEAGALPSGLYLIRATGEGFAATRAVTLLR